MSTLYLIRHGQASFAQADYDVLSDLGVQQSRLLGDYLMEQERRQAAQGPPGRQRPQGPGRPALDALYCGPRLRQRDTARHLLAAMSEAGTPVPQMVVLQELDEYPAEAIVRGCLQQLLAEDQRLAAWWDQERDAGDPFKSAAPFERIFQLAMSKWVRRELDHLGHEPFAAFSSRVQEALRRIMKQEGRGRRVAVVTSAGPVSVSMQLALALTNEVTLPLSFVVANASVTELRYREEALTLFSFNATPHLRDAGLVTYR